VDLPGEQVAVVDTVGAGDAFMSGLLAALQRAGRLCRPDLAGLTSADLGTALRCAQRVAGLTCGRVGADPPWRQELRNPGRTDDPA
jgi:fructokinase